MEVVISKPAKQTKGRMKIPIKKIQNKNKKHVTFSKRRNGLFKKASELCVLCGASVAIVTFSEAGKVFLFGHPSVDAVLHRYLYGGDGASSSSDSQSKPIEDGNGEVLWWDRPVEELGFDELEPYAAALEQIKSRVERRITDLDLEYQLKPDFDFDQANAVPIQAMAPAPVSNQMVNCHYNNFNYGVLDGGMRFGSPEFVPAATPIGMGQNQYWGCLGDDMNGIVAVANRSGYGFGDY